MPTPEENQALLSKDPGNEVFIEYAESLRNSGNPGQAILVCIAGLAANPAMHRGRFLLARIFYEQGYTTFAVRELRELSAALPEIDPLKRLIARFEPASTSEPGAAPKAAETVAESDFDIAEIELVDEER